VKLKRGSVFWQFFNVDLYSATSAESFRRDLSNEWAERWPILKSNQNSYYPLFSFLRKIGIVFSKTDVLFSLSFFKICLFLTLTFYVDVTEYFTHFRFIKTVQRAAV